MSLSPFPRCRRRHPRPCPLLHPRSSHTNANTNGDTFAFGFVCVQLWRNRIPPGTMGYQYGYVLVVPVDLPVPWVRVRVFQRVWVWVWALPPGGIPVQLPNTSSPAAVDGHAWADENCPPHTRVERPRPPDDASDEAERGETEAVEVGVEVLREPVEVKAVMDANGDDECRPEAPAEPPDGAEPCARPPDVARSASHPLEGTQVNGARIRELRGSVPRSVVTSRSRGRNSGRWSASDQQWLAKKAISALHTSTTTYLTGPQTLGSHLTDPLNGHDERKCPRAWSSRGSGADT